MKRKRFLSLLCAAFLLLAFCIPAHAAASERQLDYSRTGSISITMRTADGETIPGGTITLLHVADVVYEDGGDRFVFTREFQDCGLSVSELEQDINGAPSLAAALAEYAEAMKLNGTTVGIDGSGHAEHRHLDLPQVLRAEIIADHPGDRRKDRQKDDHVEYRFAD